jgi:anti-sigma B factor antagonist
MEAKVVESSGSLVRLEIAGRMDTVGVERAEPRFFALFAPRAIDTILDLSKVTLLTSMGLRLLIASAKTGLSKGFRVVLVAPSGAVRDVLDHAAIGELTAIVDDVDAARALLAA